MLARSDVEHRLNAVIAEYIQAVQTGRAPDRSKFLERHWDLTDGLVSFFANEDRLRHLAGLAWPRADLPSRKSRPRRRAQSPDPLHAGQDFGEFELLNEIATGGMGVVYKARHKKLNRIVAHQDASPKRDAARGRRGLPAPGRGRGARRSGPSEYRAAL